MRIAREADDGMDYRGLAPAVKASRADLPRVALGWTVIGQFLCKLLCKPLTPPVAQNHSERLSAATMLTGDSLRKSPQAQ